MSAKSNEMHRLDGHVPRRVSIAMATYNGENFIGDQLDSLVRQTRQPCELVVCDDGSTDHTLDILGKFAQSASFPVKLYRNEQRLGFADNFLKAANLCEGDLIAFCDQDDVWLETKIETCQAAFDDPEVLLVIHSAKVVDANLHTLGKNYPVIHKSRIANPLQLDPWFAPPGYAMVFVSRLIHLIDWRNRPRCHLAAPGVAKPHDQWICFLATLLGKVVLLADRLCLYRQHGLNECGASNSGLMMTLHRTINADVNTYRTLSDISDQYAHFLQEFSQRYPTSFGKQFAAGSDFYRKVGKIIAMRAMLYQREYSRFYRFKKFIQLVMSGGYQSRQYGGLGIQSLLKDIMFFIR